MATDLTRENWNSSTVDVVAVQVSINATDNTGTSRPDAVYTVGKIPKGAIIIAAYLIVDTAFDGTTPTLKVGLDADDDEFFLATSIASTGITPATLGLGIIQAVADDIIFTTVGTVDSTVGSARVYIQYIDTAARREMFTV